MVTLGMLWLPILVSAVLVFIASNLSWVVLRLHRNDWKPLPDEEALAEALNPQNLQPGEYNFPFATGPADWKSEEWQAKFKRGPVGYLTLMPAGEMGMGKNMALWLSYIVVTLVFVSYLAGHTVAAGAEYLTVFRVVGTAALLGFGGGVVPEAIWLGRRWANVGRTLCDALIYALITAGVFSWLWPS